MGRYQEGLVPAPQCQLAPTDRAVRIRRQRTRGHTVIGGYRGMRGIVSVPLLLHKVGLYVAHSKRSLSLAQD
jgi:hypothetical protein